VPVADAGALARAMASLASDQKRAHQLGVAARQTIETRFNPRTEAARLANILTRVAFPPQNGAGASTARDYVLKVNAEVVPVMD